MTRSFTRSMAAALLAFATAACGAGRMEAQTPPHPAAHHDSLGMGARLADGSHPWTEADVRFMSNMIGHHAQAMVMAAMFEPLKRRIDVFVESYLLREDESEEETAL